jgi:hypothetical protein
MTNVKSGEIAVRRDVFEGLIDELMDAIGWLSVIQDEFPEVLQRTCGTINAQNRLRQMSAILSGSTLDKRYEPAQIDRQRPAADATEEDGAEVQEGTAPAKADLREGRPE